MKRLREFDTVTVNVPFEARHARMVEMFDARVLAIIGPTAALQAVDDTDVQRLPERVWGALLSFRSQRSLVGLKGVLSARGPMGELRFTVGDGVQLNRRSATRIKTSLTMHLHRLGSVHARTGTSVDLSADGVLVQTTLSASVGEAIAVTIDVGPDGPPVEATAYVIRAAGGHLALQFAATETAARSRLAGLVVEHNRLELRNRDAQFELVDF